MKRTMPSVGDLAGYFEKKIGEKVRIPILYGKYLGTTVKKHSCFLQNKIHSNIIFLSKSNKATTLSDIMNSSRGRDKFCAFIQYVAEFYLACLKHSNIEEVRYLYE